MCPIVNYFMCEPSSRSARIVRPFVLWSSLPVGRFVLCAISFPFRSTLVLDPRTWLQQEQEFLQEQKRAPRFLRSAPTVCRIVLTLSRFLSVQATFCSSTRLSIIPNHLSSFTFHLSRAVKSLNASTPTQLELLETTRRDKREKDRTEKSAQCFHGYNYRAVRIAAIGGVH